MTPTKETRSAETAARAGTGRPPTDHRHVDDDRVRRVLLGGVWTLPAYAVLLALSTTTHQPDAATDFPGYADYVTTTPFLVSHIGASIVGAGLGVIGLVSTAVLVAAPSGRPVRALLGAALAVLGNVMATALFGVAAFAQPAIGRAYQAGLTDIVAVEADVYGGPLIGTAVAGLLMFMAGGALLGGAIRATSRRLRLVGTLYGALLVLFVLAGFTVVAVQPVAAALLAAVTVVLCLRLPGALGSHTLVVGGPS